jgi:hypothetical protein
MLHPLRNPVWVSVSSWPMCFCRRQARSLENTFCTLLTKLMGLNSLGLLASFFFGTNAMWELLSSSNVCCGISALELITYNRSRINRFLNFLKNSPVNPSGPSALLRGQAFMTSSISSYVNGCCIACHSCDVSLSLYRL